MAELSVAVNENRKAGIRRRKAPALKIDMTPMVDLGFLLITFFVFTAEITKPTAMDIKVPHDGPPMKTAGSTTMTILIGSNNKLLYYYGLEEDAKKENGIKETTYDEKTGIGKAIREKQGMILRDKKDKSLLMVVIKPGRESSYKNSVDILDEMLINNVTRYAITKPADWENKILEREDN